jgi:hypothetical protein
MVSDMTQTTAYRFVVVADGRMGGALRRRVAALLAATQGPLALSRCEWRALAFAGEGELVGHVAAVEVSHEFDARVLALGVATVAALHSPLVVGRRLYELSTATCWCCRADAIVTNAVAVRRVLTGLGYAPLGSSGWMCAGRRDLAARVFLEASLTPT